MAGPRVVTRFATLGFRRQPLVQLELTFGVAVPTYFTMHGHVCEEWELTKRCIRS